jgi:hypothetical protein
MKSEGIPYLRVILSRDRASTAIADTQNLERGFRATIRRAIRRYSFASADREYDATATASASTRC